LGVAEETKVRGKTEIARWMEIEDGWKERRREGEKERRREGEERRRDGTWDMGHGTWEIGWRRLWFGL
jgi:hypothetical protein